MRILAVTCKSIFILRYEENVLGQRKHTNKEESKYINILREDNPDKEIIFVIQEQLKRRYINESPNAWVKKKV